MCGDVTGITEECQTTEQEGQSDQKIMICRRLFIIVYVDTIVQLKLLLIEYDISRNAFSRCIYSTSAAMQQHKRELEKEQGSERKRKHTMS